MSLSYSVEAPHETHRSVFWRRHIEAQRDSGLSVCAYCQEHGLTQVSFYQWRKRLSSEQRPAEAQPPVFVPVRIVQPAVESTGAEPASLEVALGNGRVVRVRPGFDAATLVELVSALEADAC